MRTRALSALPLLAALWAVPAWAQPEVAHEYVPDLLPDEAATQLGLATEPEALSSEPGAGGGQDDSPAPPALRATPGDGALSEQPGRRSPSFRPDRITALEDRLDYYSSFEPAIAPFKRVTSLDATGLLADGRTPVLEVAEPALRPISVEDPDAPAPDPRPRDRFYGEVMLDFSEGPLVPLPSVAPDSRLLGVRSEPSTALSFARDGADNFVVRLEGPVPAGPVRLRFLTDAPRGYFSMAIPAIASDLLAAEVRPLPEALERRALGFAAELGVRRGQPLDRVLGALVGHFRAFEESSEPPPDTGDTYLDLARARRGVCRHRAYAFVVTAHALGIPARFIQNEAHSFVEVKLPDRGWLRIDLGGAANGMTAHNASTRALYQPVEPDRLPRPRAYEQSYSQLRQNVDGLRVPTLDEVRGRWLTPAAQSGSGAGEQLLGGPGVAGGQAAPDAPRAGDGREPLAVQLDGLDSSVQRGRELWVRGRVLDPRGAGLSGMRVEVSVAAVGRNERMLLGVTVSGEAGRFEGRFGVPADLSAGDYELLVIAPGDARYRPGVAH